MGEPRPGLLLATVGEELIASAARIAGTGDGWIVYLVGLNEHVTFGSEIGARAFMLSVAEGGQS
jgi:hypothetical protein